MIKVENVSFKYKGKSALALDKVSFEIAEGEIFGFLGPNGAGKSTMQKILIRLLHGYTGKIEVLGRDLSRWKREYYEKIGVGFELPKHYQKLTGLENLRFFASFYKEKAEKPEKLLEMVGLAEAADVKLSQYSKGMQMKLNLARTLLNRPQILFLDEPTSGLDPVSAGKIKDIIREQKSKGVTIFLTTHNMFIADELCDRVAFIVEGKIETVDVPVKLKMQYGQDKVKVIYNQENELKEKEFMLKGLGYNVEFYDLLKTEDVKAIHTREASLEEVFAKVTGRNLL